MGLMLRELLWGEGREDGLGLIDQIDKGEHLGVVFQQSVQVLPAFHPIAQSVLLYSIIAVIGQIGGCVQQGDEALLQAETCPIIILVYNEYCIVEMIIPSKEALLIAPADAKEIFLFDPKAACVLRKYFSDSALAPHAAYFALGQQFLIPHLNNTYLNIWETDTQEPRKYSIAEGERLTSLLLHNDSTMFMGTASGMALIYEVPSGILLSRLSLHSSEIFKMFLLPSGYVVTCSRSEIKLWPIKDLLADSVKPIPQKSIHSAAPIVSVAIVRGILAVLCENSLRTYFVNTLAQCELAIDMPEINSATCCCGSEDSLFVGDNHGIIREIPILPHQKEITYEQRRQTIAMAKRSPKQMNAKDPITQLAYVGTLRLLVSGNCKGEVRMWDEKGVKKQLFKAPIGLLHVIPIPDNSQKIAQDYKIRALHKQEMTKLESPIVINCECQAPSSNEPSQEHYLSVMLNYLNDPQELLQEELMSLKQQNEKLLEASLHYAKLFEEME